MPRSLCYFVCGGPCSAAIPCFAWNQAEGTCHTTASPYSPCSCTQALEETKKPPKPVFSFYTNDDESKGDAEEDEVTLVRIRVSLCGHGISGVISPSC